MPRLPRGRRALAAAAGVVLAAVGVTVGLLASAPAPAAPVTRPISAATVQRLEAAVDAYASAGPVAASGAPATPAGADPPRLGFTRSPVRRWVSTDVRLEYGGMPRSYLVLRPARATGRRLPVVVELAGAFVYVSKEASRADYAAVASPAVLVYPQDTGIGRKNNWNAGACCGLAAAHNVDDVGFIAAVIRQVRATVPHASHGPVYLSGYSNGGKMALRFACERPGLVRAVAVYGAVESMHCDGDHPPPVSLLEMVGDADTWTALGPGGPPIVQAGFTEPTVVDEVGYYLRADGCPVGASLTHAGSTTEVQWAACPGGRRVALAVWHDQNHGWPEDDGPTPSAQQVAWDFFAALGAARP